MEIIYILQYISQETDIYKKSFHCLKILAGSDTVLGL